MDHKVEMRKIKAATYSSVEETISLVYFYLKVNTPAKVIQEIIKSNLSVITKQAVSIDK